MTDFEDLVGKAVSNVYRPREDQPDSEEDSYVIVFGDGTRVGFCTGSYDLSDSVTYWITEPETAEAGD